MYITNSHGSHITDLNSWKEAFIQSTGNAQQWKSGRSFYSLAEHFTSPDVDKSEGIKKIKEVLGFFGYDNVSLDKGEILLESKFDSFKNGKKQDLALWGTTYDVPLTVFVDAKVDEKFGDTLWESIVKGLDAKATNSDSKKYARVMTLAQTFGLDLTDINIKRLRYQLLTWFAGSITDAFQLGESVLFMPVMVYKTDSYDNSKGEENRKDYIRFFDIFNFRLNTNYESDGIIMFSGSFYGMKVLTAYIDANKSVEDEIIHM